MNVHVAYRAASAFGATAPREKTLALGGHTFIADISGALYWPDERLLIVADLHLEKGSAYAARRVFIPPYDTAATLSRLSATIERFAPRRVIALGDSFHDNDGSVRLQPADVQALNAAQTGRDWLWIAGNHDRLGPSFLGGDHAQEAEIGGIRLRHEPSDEPSHPEIVGHLHPVALVSGRGGALRRRCFLATNRHCILPAFGAYAGGLNILDDAFRDLFFGEIPKALVLGRDAVYTVAPHQCLADPGGANVLRR